MLRIFFCINSIFCSLSFIISTQLDGKTYNQIIPITHNWFIINELAKNPLYNNPKTVFLINLYNNIFQPSQFLGSTEWILERKEYLQNQCCEDFQDQFMKELVALENYLSYDPIDPVLTRLISEVATNSNCLIFGLANRSACSIPTTLSLIHKNNLTFSQRLGYIKNSILKINKSSDPYVFFTEGVIFSNFNDLTSVCKAFFQQCHHYIDTLIYLDSSTTNLNTVQKYCEQNNINFFGLLNDDNINKYTEQKKATSILMQGIMNLLSDKAAAYSLLILFQNTLTK